MRRRQAGALFSDSPFDGLIGVDEAGRGALAGPVAVAAVLDHPGLKDAGACDSKTLGEPEREAVRERLLALPGLVWSVVLVPVEEVEARNVLQATLWGMGLAVEELLRKTCLTRPKVLVDGNKPVPGMRYLQETVIKGDALIPSIGAASILAKTTRDAEMHCLAKSFPQYGFDQHKGYGVPAHRRAILQHGATLHHRPTFLRKILENAGAE